MLPVQTVMIRYMVLVYRWGSGWSDAAGDWEGFAGDDVTGGCARRRVLAEAHLARARKGPADKGSAGPFRGEFYFDLSSSPSLDIFSGFAGSLTRVYSCFSSSQESGSKSTVPTGMSCFIPSSSASPIRIGWLNS